MDCNTTFAAVDHGYLQIASGHLYQGEINSYNCWLTKVFARLFCRYIDVQVGDRVRRLNKRSYVQFLNERGIAATLTTLHAFTDFNSIAYRRSDTKGWMRQHISVDKTASLARKMITSLGTVDIAKATKYLGKGAEVNEIFWIRGYDGKYVFEPQLTKGLPQAKIAPFTADQLSPLLFAAQRTQTSFANLLTWFGADTHFVGNRCTFFREILGVSNDTTLQPTIRPVLVGSHRHRHPDIRVHHRLGMDLQTSQTITFRDTLLKTENLFIDKNVFASTPVLEPPRIRDWSSTDLMGRIPIF